MMYVLNNGVYRMYAFHVVHSKESTHTRWLSCVGGEAVECLPLLRKVAGLSPHKKGLMDYS